MPAGARRDGIARGGASLVEGCQPQAYRADSAIGARLGDGEREANALGEPAALAVHPVQRLLVAGVGRQAPCERHIGVGREFHGHGRVEVGELAQDHGPVSHPPGRPDKPVSRGHHLNLTPFRPPWEKAARRRRVRTPREDHACGNGKGDRGYAARPEVTIWPPSASRAFPSSSTQITAKKRSSETRTGNSSSALTPASASLRNVSAPVPGWFSSLIVSACRISYLSPASTSAAWAAASSSATNTTVPSAPRAVAD